MNRFFRLSKTGLIAILTAATFVQHEPPVEAAEIVIPASWGYPLGSQTTSAPGFNGRIHQARRNANLTATIARGNAQLNGDLIDPATGQAYQNLVVSTNSEAHTTGLWFGFPVNPGGTFVETNVVNYAADNLGLPFDAGNFTAFEGFADGPFPGLPGANDSTMAAYENGSNVSTELVAYLELRAGVHQFAVNCDDAFELAFHPNDARDIFRIPVMAFDSNRGSTETLAQLRVEADGLYPMRLLHVEFANSTPVDLEFYTSSVSDPLQRTLVNDRSKATSVRAWRSVTSASRPYVKRVSPSPGSTGVIPTEPIQVVLANAGGAAPVMKVNGAAVTFTTSTSGGDTLLTHTPTQPFSGGTTVNVELSYGNGTGSWSYVTRTGRKALLITGGGQLNASDSWIAQRLAAVYSLDVIVKSDAAVTTNDAAGTVLVFNSSTVSSGQVANDNFEELPIPILNVEGGNLDDFLMHPGNAFGNLNTQTEVEIVDNAHPLAAGLTAGVHRYTTENVQAHYGTPDEFSARVIGVNPTNPGQALIFALETGSDVSGFIHPARRVHLGIIGNTGAATFNEAGVKLFDAAMTWLLPALPPKFNAPVLAGGNVTLSWTGTGKLEEAASVTGPWTQSASQTNPQTLPAAGAKFYRLRQ